jgi:type I restriction enzyme M protein
MKKFLGYEWSSAKGNEGIKYLGGQSVTVEKDEEGEEALEQDDKRVLENLLNLNNIQTPLYDPHSLLNSDKINSLIRVNFNGELVTISEAFQNYVATSRVLDMLDFSRKEFNKVISLTPRKNALIQSKWDQVKLIDMCNLMRRGKTSSYGQSSIQIIKSGQARGYKEYDFKERYYVTPDFVSDERNLQKGDLLLNSTGKGTAGRVTLFDLDGDFVVDSHITILRLDQVRALPLYFLNAFYLIGYKTIEDMATGQSGQIELSLDIIGNIKIPLPPIDIQQQIVNECEAVDKDVTEAHAKIEKSHEDITTKIYNILNLGYPFKTLEEICELKRGRFTHRPRNEPRFFGGNYPFIQTGDVVKAKVSKISYTQTLNEDGLAVSKLFQPPVVLVTIAANIGDTAVLDYPACFTDSVVGLMPKEGINARFLELMMRTHKKHLNDTAPKMAQKNINIEILKPIKVPVPPLADQENLVAKIEKLEQTIAAAQAIIAAAPAKKQAILQAYL